MIPEPSARQASSPGERPHKPENTVLVDYRLRLVTTKLDFTKRGTTLEQVDEEHTVQLW